MGVLGSLIESAIVSKYDYLGANLLAQHYHWANELGPIDDYKVKAALEFWRFSFSYLQWFTISLNVNEAMVFIIYEIHLYYSLWV